MFATGTMGRSDCGRQHVTIVQAEASLVVVSLYDPHVLLPNNGARTDNSDTQLGEYTSAEPLTLTPVEDSEPRDRFVTFSQSHT